MYKNQLEKDIQEFLNSENLEIKAPVVYSDYEDFHYQSSVLFSLTKKNPDFNSNKIISYLMATGHYEKIEITGNNFLSVKCNLNPQIKNDIQSQTVLVDYCGVNVAKQMHIGHIRSMFIGDFITRLHEALGDNVVIQNHIGDWGNQFGFLLNYIKKNNLENHLDNKKLTEYYKLAYELNNNDEGFAKESAKVAYQLQNKLDDDLYKLWEKLVNISMIEAEKTFKEFNLKMDVSHTRGESFYAPFCKDIINDLLDKKIATKESDGSVVVFFDNKSPLILQKSNGNYLYGLYDIAAVKWRVENYNPDKILYVVDKRQALHFEQVFSIAKKANYVTNTTQLIHIGFGTILGKDKKPLKTKSGQSLYLDDLLAEGKNILSQDKHFEVMNETYKEEVLNKTIVGGMKYYDLKFGKQQDYIYDWEHVLNFTGGSAPYIQNAIVRIDSIFYKKWADNYNEKEINWDFKWSEDEKEIIFNCQKTLEIIQDLSSQYMSQQLATQMIKLCQLFHKYYEKEKVLGSQKEEEKLQLLSFVKNTLINSCEVMGIETYPCQQKLEKKWKVKL